jgi:casein kinase II subunit beta
MYGLSLDESDDEEDFSGDSGWIPWFCGIKGHELFAEVEEEYIRDSFNMYGLRQRFQYYDQALEMILSNEAPDEEDLADGEFLEIYRDATHLYGLIHSRYVVSPRGLQVMREKYLKGVFGTCPRVLCERQHVLPVGTSEDLRAAQVKMFCPLCEQVYSPKSKYKELDGAYFGTSFPQVFLQSYPSLVPLEPPRPFVPRIHGFKLHKQNSIITRKLVAEEAASQAFAASKRAREGPQKEPQQEAQDGGQMEQ